MANGAVTNLDKGLGQLNRWTGAMVLAGLIGMGTYMLQDTRDDALLEGRVLSMETAMGKAEFFLKDYVRSDIYDSEIVNIHRRISAVENSSKERLDQQARRMTELAVVVRAKMDKTR